MVFDNRLKAREKAQSFAKESLTKNDPTSWFEQVYTAAAGNPDHIPWADLKVNPSFVTWVERENLSGEGKRALVVGCGLGDDAEAIAALGFETTAFDISETAIGWCRRRYPDSPVQYLVADALALPDEWKHQFDFVFEAYTLQTLPVEIRPTVVSNLVQTLGTNGKLLLIARGRDPEDDPGSLPWPLMKSELDEFVRAGLTQVSFEDFWDQEDPPKRRFRVLFVAK
ncbi:MAG: class I SAM-dependent methyltransferase [Acidobacteria bacterium]|nr:class I SAM-dependent methyltransferase [Acidobacteriota bacterium]